MYIERRKIDLLGELFNYSREFTKEETEKIMAERVKGYVDNINLLIDTDFDKLSDKEFFNLLKSLFIIKLEENDYLKVISLKNGRKYDHYDTIDSKMTVTWWNSIHKISFVVAVVKGLAMDCTYPYSKSVIKKLVDNKDVVITEEWKHLISEDGIYDEVSHNSNWEKNKVYDEEYEVIPSMYLFNRDIELVSSDTLKEEDFHALVLFLRKKIKKKRLYKDLDLDIKELRNGLYQLSVLFSSNKYFGDAYLKMDKNLVDVKILKKK